MLATCFALLFGDDDATIVENVVNFAWGGREKTLLLPDGEKEYVHNGCWRAPTTEAEADGPDESLARARAAKSPP